MGNDTLQMLIQSVSQHCNICVHNKLHRNSITYAQRPSVGSKWGYRYRNQIDMNTGIRTQRYNWKIWNAGTLKTGHYYVNIIEDASYEQ